MAGEILAQGLFRAGENIQKSQDRVNRAKATSAFLKANAEGFGLDPEQIEQSSIGELDAFADFIPQLVQQQQIGISQQRQALEQKKFERTTQQLQTQEAFATRVAQEAANVQQGGELTDPSLEAFIQDPDLVNVGNAILQGGSGAVSDQDLAQSITPDANARIKQEQAAVDLEQSQLKLQQLRQEIETGPKVDIKPQELRKEFNALQEVKDFRKVDAAFNKVRTAATGKRSAAKDLALVFNFMKILDPNSVVRESEFKTAARARGAVQAAALAGEEVPVFITQMIDKLVEGVILTDAQTKDFLQTAEGAFRGQADTVIPAIEQFRDLSTKRGFPVEDILRKSDVDLFNTFQAGLQTGAGLATEPPAPELVTSFDSLALAEAANLPSGTEITIGGRRAIVE